MRIWKPLFVTSAALCLAPIVLAGTKPAAKRAAAPTIARDVAPLLHAHCASCHRPGEVAPFSLLTYEDARKRAKLIALVTQKRLMPPWKAEPHGAFLNERRLAPAQIETLRAWAEAGGPAGDLKAAPAPPKFGGGWALGEPGLTVTPPEPYAVRAEGRDIYRCFVIPAHSTEDRYVAALDVRPGNRAVVHHVLAYVDTSGKARELDAKDPGPGYDTPGGVGFTPAGMIGGWAPGAVPHRLPASAGILLPKGADVVLEVHYHPTGKPETDHTRVALYFNDPALVERPMRLFPLLNAWFRLPPGDRDHVVRASFPVPADVTVYNVFPHMHLLGRQMEITAKRPDGTKRRLVSVADWDFNWQGFYQYREPVKLPKGTWLDLTARYDNSASNPRNPHTPPKPVTWGEQTTDEMCLAFLGFTVDAERITSRAALAEVSQKRSKP